MTPEQTIVFTIGIFLIGLSAFEFWRPQLQAVV